MLDIGFHMWTMLWGIFSLFMAAVIEYLGVWHASTCSDAPVRVDCSASSRIREIQESVSRRSTCLSSAQGRALRGHEASVSAQRTWVQKGDGRRPAASLQAAVSKSRGLQDWPRVVFPIPAYQGHSEYDARAFLPIIFTTRFHSEALKHHTVAPGVTAEKS